MAESYREDNVDEGAEYEELLLLDELESLLEEMEEGGEDTASEIGERLRQLGIGSQEELSRRIRELHGALDQNEPRA